jgi:hypothetical protein
VAVRTPRCAHRLNRENGSTMYPRATADET